MPKECCRQLALRRPGREVVERPGPATGMATGGARNRMLARLPKPALASDRKVPPSIGAFSRTMSALGGRRYERWRGRRVLTPTGHAAEHLVDAREQHCDNSPPGLTNPELANAVTSSSWSSATTRWTATPGRVGKAKTSVMHCSLTAGPGRRTRHSP
jgi:hypothetical protein